MTLMGGTCPHCARAFKAAPPADMAPGSPFGPNLRALALHLRFSQGIGFDRLQGAVPRRLRGGDQPGRAGQHGRAPPRRPFAAQAARLRERLRASPVLASDETGLRVAGQNGWLWVMHHGDSAVFRADPSRAKRVLADFLGEHRPDFWISDRYGGQKGFATPRPPVLPRASDPRRAIRRRRRRHRLRPRVPRAPEARLPHRRAPRPAQRRQLAACHRKFVKKLSELLQRPPTHAAGAKLQTAIAKGRRNLFLFVTNRALEPTNNGSERALRPCVTFRKITGGFRTAWGADLYADIRSVLETARRRAIPPLQAIVLTLKGRPLPLQSA